MTEADGADRSFQLSRVDGAREAVFLLGLAVAEPGVQHGTPHRDVEPGRHGAGHARSTGRRALQRESDDHRQQAAQHPDQLQLGLEAGKGTPQQGGRHVPLGDGVERRLGRGGRETDGEGEQGLYPQRTRGSRRECRRARTARANRGSAAARRGTCAARGRASEPSSEPMALGEEHEPEPPRGHLQVPQREGQEEREEADRSPDDRHRRQAEHDLGHDTAAARVAWRSLATSMRTRRSGLEEAAACTAAARLLGTRGRGAGRAGPGSAGRRASTTAAWRRASRRSSGAEPLRTRRRGRSAIASPQHPGRSDLQEADR